MPSRKPADRSGKSSPVASGLALGIDLGATKVVAGLVAADGTLVRHSGRHLHKNDGPGGVIGTLVECAQVCLKDLSESPGAIGVAVAAQVDPRTGTVVHAPNLGWRDVPLARRVAEQLGGPVRVVNDARAATFAEWRHGAGTGSDDLFCLFLGTGVGGSAVVGGRLLEGGSHAFGEVGHLTIVSGGRKCHCPNWGCLEAYVGGWAIAERARDAMRADPDAATGLLALATSLEAVTAETVFRACRAGDPLASRLVRETERFLADGVVGIVNAFNPSVLILGGGIVSGLPTLIPVAESAVRARCQPPAAGARVLAAKLGEDAPLIGAAELARG
ncbi:MAG: ROK family protein [Thermoplasmata archaeon]